MATNAATRAKARAQGLCISCMELPAGTGTKDLCSVCRDAHVEYLRKRYEERRAAGLCVQCGAPAQGYLCEKHEAARRKRRQRSSR